MEHERMISRLLTVGVAWLGLFLAGSVGHAQEFAEPDSGAAPGRASLGAAFGVSHHFADADYSEGASPRIASSARFRYVVNDWLRLQFGFGHTWTAYANDRPAPFADLNFPDDTLKTEHLSQVVPIAFQLQLLRRGPQWVYHVGAGPGIYRVWLQNRRKVLKDPVTLRLHRGLYWGASGQIGAERFLAALPSTSVELGAAAHWVFAERDEQFPSGYNSFVAVAEVTIGVNYYFTPPVGRPKTQLPPGIGGP
jgi:hypothetical protein